jgi:uncharacterized protein YndB with AHSA1/START domain
MNLTAETHIASPPERVWDHVVDPESWAGLIPMARRVELLTPGPVVAGTRARITLARGGQELTSEAEVITVDAPRTLVLRNRVPALNVDVEAVLTLTPAQGGTQVRQAVTIHFANRLSRKVGEGMVRAQNPEARLREGLARLKQAAETGP